MWQWFVILAAVGAFLYKIRAIRGDPKTIHHPEELLPFFGSVFSLFANLHEHHDWKTKQLKDAVAAGKEVSCWSILASPPNFEMASPRMVQYMLKDEFDNFIKEPFFQEALDEFLGRGIFNVDGESWRSQRKVAAHMFSSRQLSDHMMRVFQEHSKLVIDRLGQIKEGEAIDMFALFGRYTLDSIAQVAFGVSINCLTRGDKEQPPFAAAFDVVQEISANRWMAPPILFQTKRAFGFGSEGVLSRNMVILNEFVYAVVRQRKANLDAFANSGDLLSLFLNDAQKRGEVLSDVFLRDIVLNFLIAGRDTTASALSYMFKALSDYPDIEEKVVEEIIRIIGKDGEVDELNVKDLIYLEAVFLETIRLFPPVSADLKVSIKECIFPDGTVIPAGSRCCYSPWGLARLTSIWGEDAEEFKPERWLDEDNRIIQPSNYKFPHFNAGLRLCLGKQMAINEAKVLAVSILQRHSLRVVPGSDTSYKMSVTLVLRSGLQMTVRPRNASH